MKLKANYDLVLPDKTEVKVGDTFDFDGDVKGTFGNTVSIVEEAPKDPEGDANTPDNPNTPDDKNTAKEMTDDEVRAYAQKLGIEYYYNKGIDRLKKEIAEKEAAPAGDPEAPKDPEGDANTPDNGGANAGE